MTRGNFGKNSFIFIVIVSIICGCSKHKPPVKKIAPPVSLPQSVAKTAAPAPQQPIVNDEKTKGAVPAPTGVLVYQPMFKWAKGDPTFQGTGFLVKTSSGKIVGVTSAHFVEFEGPAMTEATWLNVVDEKPAITFTHCYCRPETYDDSNPFDKKTDYLVFSNEKPDGKIQTLELDRRGRADKNERVWLPNKDASAPNGYTLIAGTVTMPRASSSMITFDDTFELQSQSGSPIISQKTGKVIGTLSSGGDSAGTTSIMIAPAKPILDAIDATPGHKPLQDSIGKK
jgi:hypothetical protein